MNSYYMKTLVHTQTCVILKSVIPLGFTSNGLVPFGLEYIDMKV